MSLICHVMWFALTILLLLALGALHLWWSRRFREARAASESETARLKNRQVQALSEAQAQQAALFDSMAEGFLLLDARGRIQMSNRAFKELFAISAELPGRTVLEVVRLHELADLVARLVREDRVLGYELRHHGDTTRCIEVNAASIRDSSGGLLGTVLVFHDLTRVKRLEESSSDLVANVSHELRTPISMIKGYVETLLSGAKDDPAALTRFLGIIERHSNRLALLIDDLLVSSELESGRASLALEAVALRPIVDRVFEELEPRARARGVNLVNKVTDLVAHADGDRLRQVFVNLIDNAIKYGRQEGVVTVGGRALDDRLLQLCVSDDGPGLPPEALSRLFEPFYRLDKARSREHGGTGLGLSIVRDIIRRHGGEIWVESEASKGAAFFFTVPRHVAGQPVQTSLL